MTVANSAHDPATTLQLFLPVLIILPVLYFRMRRMAKPQPLKLDRLWIRPALIIAVAALVLVLPQPGQHASGIWRRWTGSGWHWPRRLAASAGWHWGRTMAIEVHPEDGTLMVTAGRRPCWCWWC